MSGRGKSKAHGSIRKPGDAARIAASRGNFVPFNRALQIPPNETGSAAYRRRSHK